MRSLTLSISFFILFMFSFHCATKYECCLKIEPDDLNEFDIIEIINVLDEDFMKMRMSDKGIGFLKNIEKLALTSYQDTKKRWAIGYGHVDPTIKKGMTCSESQAETWLKEDLIKAENAVNEYVQVEITQDQFDSLVSFVYNCGISAFKRSTLLKNINNQLDSETIKSNFLSWHKITVKGKKIPSNGLKNRRMAEAKIFILGYEA